MDAPSLFLVDVFAEKPYAGNQLAVVVGASPQHWPTGRMQAFAREMNFSETTFASATPRDGAFDVRIFTPAEELPFAGHPTLGTAWVLARYFDAACAELAQPAGVAVPEVGGAAAPPSRLTLRLGVGEVPVEIAEGRYGEVVRMRPRPPILGVEVDGASCAAMLGLDARALDDRHPCQRVDVGVEFLLVPLRNLDALRAAAPKTLPAGEPGRMLGVLAFSPEAYEPGGDLSARMFFEAFGVREDPATGSAAACLAAWLSAHRYFGGERVHARVQQGYELGRPSCLYVGAEPRDGAIHVEVAGKVVLVARGEVA